MLLILGFVDFLREVAGTHNQFIIHTIDSHVLIVMSGCQEIIHIVDIFEKPQMSLLSRDIPIRKYFSCSISHAIHNDIFLKFEYLLQIVEFPLDNFNSS